MAETSTKKHLSVTVYYLLIAMGMGWPALMATGRLLSLWKTGNTLSPLSLAAIHTLVLGSMMTIAFGVLYQIVPIAFQAPPVARHVLFWHLPIHLLSVILMVIGFLHSRFLWVGIGGSMLLIAAGVYFAFVLQSFRKARNKTPVHRSLTIPFVSLLLVILVGIFQAFVPQDVTQSVVMTHVLLGGLAFWGGLVLVLSYKLFPMFIISHGYKASLVRTASLYFSGVALWLVKEWLPSQAWTPLDMAVTILILYGLISFVVDMIAVVRARKRKRIVLPLYDAMVATAAIVIAQVWILALLWLHDTRSIVYAVYLFAFGGLIPLMFAYMQKIVPFLWFEYRFSKRPERKTAPLIDDMVPKRPAQTGFIIYYIGVLLGLTYLIFAPSRVRPHAAGAGSSAAAGAGAGSAVSTAGLTMTPTYLSWLSAACLTIGSFVLFLALQHVLTIGGKRPNDDAA